MREELWHPLSAHIPITILLFLPLLIAFEMYSKKQESEKLKILETINPILFSMGLVFAVMTTYLGDMALDIIGPSFSKVQLIYEHEHLAHMTLVFFGLSFLAYNLKHLKKYVLLFLTISLILSSVGLGYLVLTGHGGSDLVYEHGAAVKRHQ